MPALTDIESLVKSIQASPKYRCVCEELITTIGSAALQSCRDKKSAEQAARARLHQIAGAYLDSRPDYVKWKRAMAAADTDDALRTLCRTYMRAHSSTRERLPVVERMFVEILGLVEPIRSIVDIGCGLNPLAIPWMGLASGVRYDAYDIYTDMAEFLTTFLARIGVQGEARAEDFSLEPRARSADLALILKFLPVIEQINRGRALEWMQKLDARRLLVSFPTQSLCGKSKGMARNYGEWFEQTVSPTGWSIARFEYPGELCYLVTR